MEGLKNMARGKSCDQILAEILGIESLTFCAGSLAPRISPREARGLKNMARGKSRKTIELIGACHQILAEIQPATVRAVCYRLFTMGLIPDMSKSSTNGVSRQLVYARETGVIPWPWVVDETRRGERIISWDDPEEFADNILGYYTRNRWVHQPQQVEVWSEKGTVRGTLSPVINGYGVTFRVMHGYGSATVVNDIAKMTCDFENPLLAIYIGDWDPSGLHMSVVDLPERLERYGARVVIERLALTRDQITNHKLPSFAAITKAKDPRYQWFVDRYGAQCWELDALSPVVLREAVKERILGIIDTEYWDRCGVVERAEKESLVGAMTAWKLALDGIRL